MGGAVTEGCGGRLNPGNFEYTLSLPEYTFS